MSISEEEASMLNHGLYRIFWKETVGGGESVCVIGSTYSGERWFAVASWTYMNAGEPVQVKLLDKLSEIERIEPITEVSPLLKQGIAGGGRL